MYFWISPFGEPSRPRDLAALSNLGDAGYYGRHAVVSSRQFLSKLSQVTALSATARAYFGWMAEAFTQFGRRPDGVQSIVVDPTVTAAVRVAGEWRVPLGLLADPDYLVTAELIAENETDFAVLKRLAEVYSRRSLAGYVLKMRSRPGGGNTTAQVLSSAKETPNPVCICVVDSDREQPDGSLGETAKRCARGFESQWRLTLHILDARELENILPLPIVRSVAHATGISNPLIDGLHRVARELRLYACLKTGESPCRFHGIDNSHGGFAKVRGALAATAAQMVAFRACGNECAGTGCQLFPRLGDTFLARVAEWLEQPANWRNIPAPDDWEPELSDVVKRLVDTAVAFPARVA